MVVQRDQGDYFYVLFRCPGLYMNRYYGQKEMVFPCREAPYVTYRNFVSYNQSQNGALTVSAPHSLDLQEWFSNLIGYQRK